MTSKSGGAGDFLEFGIFCTDCVSCLTPLSTGAAAGSTCCLVCRRPCPCPAPCWHGLTCIDVIGPGPGFALTTLFRLLLRGVPGGLALSAILLAAPTAIAVDRPPLPLPRLHPCGCSSATPLFDFFSLLMCFAPTPLLRFSLVFDCRRTDDASADTHGLPLLPPFTFGLR